MKAVSLLYIFLVTCSLVASQEIPSKFVCINRKCVRNYEYKGNDTAPIDLCKLTCESGASLWPLPSGKVELGQTLILINPNQIFFSYPEDGYLKSVWKIFVNNIRKEHGKAIKSGAALSIMAHVGDINTKTLRYDTIESYKLKIQSNETHASARIITSTVFGARHALETLSQLFSSYKVTEKERQLVMISEADISDSPFYPHRGLLIDSSRHYLSIRSIRRTIDAMGASKMNVLHWHVTDSHSFPLQLPRVPQLARYGAYSDEEIYTPRDVEDLRNYAILRGVRILMEFDAPAHAGNGWQFGPEEGMGNLSLFINVDSWRNYCGQPPCGQLNPTNEKLYDVLSLVYKDLADMFSPTDIFHMGGDEIFFESWEKSQDVVSWMTREGIDINREGFMDLWGKFQKTALDLWDSAANGTSQIILWSSDLTQPDVIDNHLSPERYIVETWVDRRNHLPLNLADKGYKIIMATQDAWYLDHGFWGQTRYNSWEAAYNNKLPVHPNILGGEACMWGELVDDQNLDQRIWPRASAAAERLWSNPASGSHSAGGRFVELRRRLIKRGIAASPITPQSCVQNTDKCL